MRYPGSKNSSGSWQQIISEIPLCELYVEGFAGSAAVWRNMRPAARSVLIDRDFEAVRALKLWASVAVTAGLTAFVNGDFTVLCDGLRAVLDDLGSRAVVYLDPPYLFEARAGGRKRIYRHEFGEVGQHRRLLDLVRSLNCCVLVSGYASWLYDQELAGWRRKEWQVSTRRGLAVECLWMNYPAPALLQDSRFVGSNFIERQRIRRLIGVERR